jgi:phosphohistidine phosphatase SixA
MPYNSGACGEGVYFMRLFLKWLTICAFLSAFFTPRMEAQNSRTIYLVRHADKVSEDTDAPLSDAGRKRAVCLANTLKDSRIQQIFTSDLQRTQQTAAPLAEILHLKPVAVPIGKPDELVKVIRSSRAANILVIWHDATLPEIMRGLGGPEITPIAHTEYDRFFVLTLFRDGKDSKAGFAELRYCDGL